MLINCSGSHVNPSACLEVESHAVKGLGLRVQD